MIAFAMTIGAYGMYHTIVGFSWFFLDKKTIDWHARFFIWYTRFSNGAEAVEEYRNHILASRSYQFHGMMYMIVGIVLILMAQDLMRFLW